MFIIADLQVEVWGPKKDRAVIGVEYLPITDNKDAANAGYMQLGANNGAVFDHLRRSLSAGCSRELSLARFMWEHRPTFRVRLLHNHLHMHVPVPASLVLCPDAICAGSTAGRRLCFRISSLRASSLRVHGELQNGFLKDKGIG